MNRWVKPILSIATIPVISASANANTIDFLSLRTAFGSIKIDDLGRVRSLKSNNGKEYSPANSNSPLITLHLEGSPNSKLISPKSIKLERNLQLIRATFPNGSVATIRWRNEGSHLVFELKALTHREKIDNVVWGPVQTTITKTLGDLIGVVRDGSTAIGMIGLDDNTIGGPVVDGDCHGLGYIVHSPDPVKYPLPPGLKEGQWFNLGGDGVNDVAFSSHREEFFRQVFGNAVQLAPGIGSTLAYHSRNRRKPTNVVFSLLPGFQGSRPRHMVTDPVAADYIGSKVALYICPDSQGLQTIEKVIRKEGLPYPTFDGKWVHDPAANHTDMAWYGPHDRMIEYASALGIKGIQDEGQGEYYANPADHWQGNRVGMAHSNPISYRDLTAQTNNLGIKYGLHTLCLFLQPGRCSDVTPVPNPGLQTILRTHLAKPLNESATNLVVTDPSFLGEDGTWPMRDGSNTLRIGSELLTYTAVSSNPPYVVSGLKRGVAGTKAQAHPAGVELAKLQMNCYNGYCPDINLMLDYADYYAKVMTENGMEYIDYDGLESTVYQSQGYFGVRRFIRRFFETYAKLNHGKFPRVMGAGVFPGEWEYVGNCNVGGGNNMFDPVHNRWGIEGKDMRVGFGSSYFAPTFGIQDFQSDWSALDVENLQAKAIGWDASYMFGLSQTAVERSGEKGAIFKAFRAWEDARSEGIFSADMKTLLQSLDLKFHLEKLGKGQYRLTPVSEVRLAATVDSGYRDLSVKNPFAEQSLDFAFRVDKPVLSGSLSIGFETVPFEHRLEAGQYLMVRNGDLILADKYRKELVRLASHQGLRLKKGDSLIRIEVASADGKPVPTELTVWAWGSPRLVGKK